MKEFAIIKKFFSARQNFSNNTQVGIGDDAAVVSAPSNQKIVITTDTFSESIHFPSHTKAYDIGYKALAVNLSDLAAMGAKPMWVTLALAFPRYNEEWLKEFSQGFFDLANEHNIQLIGGDTTRGHLSITIQAMGLATSPLLRSEAKVEDLIFVSGTLGDAGVGLQLATNKIVLPDNFKEFFITKLNRPIPQINLGKSLEHISHCAIDISDGLIADVNHILEASNVGAEINLEKIPLSQPMQQCFSREEGIKFALTSGDDYQLCFTLSENIAKQHTELLTKFHCTLIGKITSERKLKLFFNDQPYQENLHGYEHFE